MRKIPPVTYQTPEEVDSRIQSLQADADALPPGLARQPILIEISKLRAYADMKRWIDAPKKGSS